jgi:uncharacterized protein (DUF2147 family)
MRAPALALVVLIATAGACFSEPAALVGTWLTADGSSKMRFEPCGNTLCGRLIWLRQPNDPETGKPILDKNNPNPALRSRPLLGAPIFTGVRALNPAEWIGNAYNAEDSKTYDVTLRLSSPNQLELRGCVLGGLFCQSESWARDH